MIRLLERSRIRAGPSMHYGTHGGDSITECHGGNGITHSACSIEFTLILA